MQKSIDICWPPGPQQQTRRSGVRRPNDGMEGQTDGRTLGSCVDLNNTSLADYEKCSYIDKAVSKM